MPLNANPPVDLDDGLVRIWDRPCVTDTDLEPGRLVKVVHAHRLATEEPAEECIIEMPSGMHALVLHDHDAVTLASLVVSAYRRQLHVGRVVDPRSGTWAPSIPEGLDVGVLADAVAHLKVVLGSERDAGGASSDLEASLAAITRDHGSAFADAIRAAIMDGGTITVPSNVPAVSLRQFWAGSRPGSGGAGGPWAPTGSMRDGPGASCPTSSATGPRHERAAAKLGPSDGRSP